MYVFLNLNYGGGFVEQKVIIGMRIKKIREERGMEKSEAASKLDVNYSTYTNWEAGNREPSAEMLAKIATFYRVTLDYLYGRDLKFEEFENSRDKSGVIAAAIGDLKKVWSERDRSIKIKIHWYEKLLQEADFNPNRVHFVVDRLIADHYKKLEDENQAQLRKLEQQEALEDYYNYLEQLLEVTKKGSIQIGLTNGRVGRETSRDVYKLKDFTVSSSYTYVTLNLERKGEEWPITFNKIKDIKFSDCGHEDEGRMKTWIYMPGETWRFYLNYTVSDLKSK